MGEMGLKNQPKQGHSHEEGRTHLHVRLPLACKLREVAGRHSEEALVVKASVAQRPHGAPAGVHVCAWGASAHPTHLNQCSVQNGRHVGHYTPTHT